MRRGPTIRKLLLAVGLFVLLIPVAAVLTLRVVETQLVRQTEGRLIAESVLIGEVWRDRLLEERGLDPAAVPVAPPPGARDDRYFPIEPRISLRRDGVLPPAPPPARSVPAGDGPEWRAGRRIHALIERSQRTNLSGARVLDAGGCTVATTADDVGACFDHLPEVREALGGDYAAVVRERVSDEPAPPLGSISRRGRLRVFTATPVFSDGVVIGVVRMSRTSLDPLEWLAGQWPVVVAGSLACVLLTAAISWFLAYAISRPVRAITRAAQAVARGEPRGRFFPGGLVPAEVHALGEALDAMTRQLTDRARTISDFATNLSHELKTPLAGIRGAVELLRDDWQGMSPEQRRRFLDNVGADAGRMQALVDRLLQLARVQNAPDTAEEVALHDFFERLARPHGERVVLDLSRAPAAVSINRDHLGFAVRNLLDNALRHGAKHPVHVTVAGRDGRLVVDVADRGPGISEANRARVFQPFFTTERERGGTGLGLAIVRAVAETRGGSVQYQSGPEGTTFTLTL